jgi:hypothetical protein
MKTLRLMAIVLLVGCGGTKASKNDASVSNNDAGVSNNDAGISINDFPQRYAQALCSKNFQCCDASELVGKMMSTCVSDNQAVIAILISEINASQARGRVSYDPNQSGICISSLEAMTCDEFKQGIGGNMAACMAFIMPRVAQGGACTQGYECTTGNCAGADTSVDPPVEGMCAAAPVLAAVGASCATSECVDNAYCDTATTTCQPLKAAGVACTSDSECINSCNPTTYTCSCYAGCQVAAATTTRGTLLSLLVLGVGLVVTRARRRRRRQG